MFDWLKKVRGAYSNLKSISHLTSPILPNLRPTLHRLLWVGAGFTTQETTVRA